MGVERKIDGDQIRREPTGAAIFLIFYIIYKEKYAILYPWKIQG